MSKYVRVKDRLLPAPVSKGPTPSHGAYSLYHRDELLKANPEVGRFLKRVQAGLIRDLAPQGPAFLTAAQEILIGRLMSKLLQARLIELYLARFGFFRRDALARKTLATEPCFDQLQTLNNGIRRDLQALGLERKPIEMVMTHDELLKAVEAERDRGDIGDAQIETEGPDPAGILEPECLPAPSDAEDGKEGESDR